MSDLVWSCDVCQQPVRAGEGYMEVDRREAMRVHDARLEDEHRRRGRVDAGESPWKVYMFTMSDLAELERDVAWRVYHHACDPNTNSDTYWFGVERIATLADVVDWTVHLLEKRWFDSTNWSDVCRRAIYLAANPQVRAS